MDALGKSFFMGRFLTFERGEPLRIKMEFPLVLLSSKRKPPENDHFYTVFDKKLII